MEMTREITRRLWAGDFEEWIKDWAHGILGDELYSADSTGRWLLCWNGEESGSGFDCACCLTDWRESEKDHEKLGWEPCGCICHQRIRSLARYMRVQYERWLREDD